MVWFTLAAGFLKRTLPTSAAKIPKKNHFNSVLHLDL